MSFFLAKPNDAAGGTEAAHSSLIMYTQLVAAFMIENDILPVSGAFLLLLSRDGNQMNEDCEQQGVWN